MGSDSKPNDSIANDVFQEIDKSTPLAAYEKFVYTYQCNHCLHTFFEEKSLDFCPCCGSYDLTESVENKEIVFNRLEKVLNRRLKSLRFRPNSPLHCHK